MPAQFTRISIGPSRDSSAVTAWEICAGSVTSKALLSTVAPRSRSCCAAWSSASRSRPLTMTRAPAPARASARPKPMPREEPVTRACFPARPNSCVSSLEGSVRSCFASIRAAAYLAHRRQRDRGAVLSSTLPESWWKNTMLAAVCHGRKDLRIEPVEDRQIGSGEVRVAVVFGGICGSDIHYFHDGAVGDFTVREPLTLGHEISGIVVEVGADVSHLSPGMKAALDPSRPCLTCNYCRAGR